ncbi:MAG: hypothetical protein GF344_13040, partial [Chitinivibrionales bacterium]|nr:hypothetical protein [Chitinivibrionales bacterium]MBD3357660.1 hypothetical protein [Chitinivibrionales bacterium]
MKECTQLELPLFAPPTFERVAAELGCDKIKVEFCSRLRRSWRMSRKPSDGVMTLRLPAALRDAPHQVKRALLMWALMPSGRTRRRKTELKRKRTALEATVWEYLGQVTDLRCRHVCFNRSLL